VSLLAAICISLAACGGGGSSNTAAAPGSGGTGSYTIGPISGFGSIIINGVRYKDNSATRIETEDGDTTDADKGTNNLTSDDLELGMIAEVEAGTVTPSVNGSMPEAQATVIRYTNEIKGPVTTIGTNSLTILGQVIKVNAGTVFSGVTNLTAATNTNCPYAEVYAYFNASDSTYSATRVECKTTQPSDYRLFGLVTSKSSTTSFIVNNSLTVTSSQSSAVNSAVTVRVRLNKNWAGPGNAATATRVTVVGARNNTSDTAHLEGLISNYTSDRAFIVNGVSVQVPLSVSVPPLSAGKRVEVEGALSSGVLTASHVDIEDDSELNTEIEAVGIVSDFTNTGTSINFKLTTSSLRIFNVTYIGSVAGLANDKRVEVHGDLAPNSNTSIIAKTVEVHN